MEEQSMSPNENNLVRDLALEVKENSTQTKRLVDLMEGDKDRPGILAQHHLHHQALFGDASGEHAGLVRQMRTMWHFRTWAMCTTSAGLGMAAKWLFERL